RVLNTWTGIWDFPPKWTLENSGMINVLMYSLISLLAFSGMVRAVRDRREAAVPLMISVFVFPAVYYLTHSDLGFRHPIDPVMAVFLVYGLPFIH
ncbi:MAG: hypothetical protein ACRD4Y_05775, partial [Candidatus Acidiferrales bacterium]